METVPHIPSDSGILPADDPTPAPFMIGESFHETGALVRIAAVIFALGAALIIAIGVFSLVFPIAIVGVLGLIGAGFLFWQSTNLADLTKVK
jgi:hypothetical protein